MAGTKPRITYDPDADALYVHVDGGGAAVRTEVDEHGVIKELDDQQRLVGVELLQVRYRGVDLGHLPAAVVDAVRVLLESGAVERGERVGY